MWIAAAMIECAVPDADSLKARRRVANAIKDRIRQRYNASVAEVGDPEDRHHVCIGIAAVGVVPRHLRESMSKIIRYVESTGLAEVVGDDVVVLRLDEVEASAEEGDEIAAAFADVAERGGGENP